MLFYKQLVLGQLRSPYFQFRLSKESGIERPLFLHSANDDFHHLELGLCRDILKIDMSLPVQDRSTVPLWAL